MKTLATPALALALLLCGVIATGCSTDRMARCPLLNPEAPVKHIVLFKFKDTATPEQIKQVTDAFAALPSQIPQVRSLEWGTNVSHEGKSDGLTHAWILSFENTADRDAYLVSPPHKKFSTLARPILAKVTVVDFIAHE